MIVFVFLYSVALFFPSMWLLYFSLLSVPAVRLAAKFQNVKIFWGESCLRLEMSLLPLPPPYTTAAAAAAACNYERPICTQGVICYKTTCKTNNRCNCIYNIPPIIPSHVLGLSLRFLICHIRTKPTYYLYSKWVIFVARHPFSCVSAEENPSPSTTTFSCW